MVSSGRLGLGLGDSQELKKDWMNGSRCCPFWQRKHKIGEIPTSGENRMTNLNTGLGVRQNFLLCDDGKCQGDKLRNRRKKRTCTQNKQAAVHFSPPLSACWAPTWWSYLQNINISSQLMYGSVTFFRLCLYHQHSTTQKPKVGLGQHFRSMYDESWRSHAIYHSVFCGRLSLYLGSRRAASCPGTETPRCEGRGSRPGVGCCSAPDAAGVSARGKTWRRSQQC